MEYKLLKAENYKVSEWAGGKTTQLAIFPEEGNYLERNFIWRLSSATCEQEESVFSKLPDYDRVLVVLEGKVVLAHDGVRVSRLNPLEQDRFDGGYKTKSFGKIKDYNLMVKKENQGFVDVINLSEDSRTYDTETYPEYKYVTQGFFCNQGFATVSVNGETMMLEENQQIVVNYLNSERVEISVMGDGVLIRSQIFYNYESGDMAPVEIPREKATIADFKDCFVIANTQFRGAQYLFKKLRTRWYDEALCEGMKKIDKFYLTFFIYLIGLIVITVVGIEKFKTIEWIMGIGIWTLVDIIIISPLLYMAVVPKPVAKHIKDINNLTPYEQKVFERQSGANERLERLLKKYRYTGKALYDEDGNRTDKTF